MASNSNEVKVLHGEHAQDKHLRALHCTLGRLENLVLQPIKLRDESFSIMSIRQPEANVNRHICKEMKTGLHCFVGD